MNFETYEADLANKSQEFRATRPTGKVPVIADGESIHEPNVISQYLDEVFEAPQLLPEDAKRRAYARIWIALADDFFSAVFVRAWAVSEDSRRRGSWRHCGS